MSSSNKREETKKPSKRIVSDQEAREEVLVYRIGYKQLREGKLESLGFDSLSKFYFIEADDPQKKEALDRLSRNTWSEAESRAVGCLLGLAIGDALGAPLEFSDVRYGVQELKMMGQEDVWGKEGYNRFRLKPGQWTDDTSMSLCLADSLLCKQGWDAYDCRWRFHCWWSYGYNNAFGNDDERPKHNSVGLGGNIGASLDEFISKRTEYTTAGDAKTSGNGSLMRCAPIPIFFHRHHKQALKFARLMSLTTHQGEEAAECARLLAHIIVSAINHPSDKSRVVKQEVLTDLLSEAGPCVFSTDLYSVSCLANSMAEARHESNEGAELVDRNWNWKASTYHYSPARAKEMPGYVGSYCMDALAMALHCVWTTRSAASALLKCVNMRGDADTVGAITGQIAGAIYGLSTASGVPLDWVISLQNWDNGGDIATRAYKLFHALAATDLSEKRKNCD